MFYYSLGTVVQVYFSLSLQAALISATLFAIIFIKMLSFLSVTPSFPRDQGQVCKYFCTFVRSEVMPALALWGVLMITDNYLIKTLGQR